MENGLASSGMGKLVGFCLIGAPLAMLVGDGIGLILGPGPLFVPTLFLWLSFYLFIPAILGLAVLSGLRGMGVAGALIGMMGCLFGTTIMGLDRTAWSMGRHGISESKIVEVLMEPALFLSSRAPGLTFPIGLLFLSAAAGRAGVLNRAAASCLAVGALLFPAGRIVFGFWVNVLSDVLMLAALMPLGLGMVRGGTSASPSCRFEAF